MTQELATFAGGCFWCIEPQFVNLPGVISVTSGYMGGHAPNPTYEDVCTGHSGHIEVIQLAFDPAHISYEALLEIFWRNIDPFDSRGQFVDKGSQYLAGVFTHGEVQASTAAASRDQVAATFGAPVASFIRPAEEFFPAEEYHQRYYEKNPVRYYAYSNNNGRKPRLRELWEKDTR